MRVIKNEFQLAAMQWSKITFIYDLGTGAFTFLNFGEQNRSMPDPGERYDTAMWHSIMHPNDISKDEKLREEIKSGLSRSEADLRLKIDGGKDYRWYHFIAETIRDASGKPEKMLGTLSDIEATYNQISELRRQIEHDQTEVLLTQISSHFFYHTLNAIQALLVLEPERASKMIYDFSRYLRYRIDSVGSEKGLVTLKEEMRSVTAYADINVVQLGERLKVRYEIETEDFEIPVLTVQPIVENAIIHGIKPKAEGGTVRIRASEKADCYQVTVEDDGVGFIPDEAKKHASVGMHNILTRLGRYKDCSMTIVSEKGSGTYVTLSFPKTMEVMGG
jgi:LytS/YehU family sensor histidine kinase